MACGNVCTPTRFVQRKLYIIEHNSINIHDGGGWCTTVDVVVVVVDVVVDVVDVVWPTLLLLFPLKQLFSRKMSTAHLLDTDEDIIHCRGSYDVIRTQGGGRIWHWATAIDARKRVSFVELYNWRRWSLVFARVVSCCVYEMSTHVPRQFYMDNIQIVWQLGGHKPWYSFSKELLILYVYWFGWQIFHIL